MRTQEVYFSTETVTTQLWKLSAFICSLMVGKRLPLSHFMFEMCQSAELWKLSRQLPLCLLWWQWDLSHWWCQIHVWWVYLLEHKNNLMNVRGLGEDEFRSQRFLLPVFPTTCPLASISLRHVFRQETQNKYLLLFLIFLSCNFFCSILQIVLYMSIKGQGVMW